MPNLFTQLITQKIKERKRQQALDILDRYKESFGPAEELGFKKVVGSSEAARGGAASLREPTRPGRPVGEDEALREFMSLGPNQGDIQNFEAEMGNIRRRQAFDQFAPDFSKALGVDEKLLRAAGPEGLQLILDVKGTLARMQPKEGRKQIIHVQRGDKQVFAVADLSTGQIKELPFTGEVPAPKGPVTQWTGPNGEQLTIWPSGSAKRAEEIATGTINAKVKQQYKEQLASLTNFARMAGEVDRKISTGNEPLGTVGEYTGKLVSAAKQITAGTQLAGFPEYNQYLEKFQSPLLQTTATEQAELRTSKLALAAIIAKLRDPSGRDISVRELETALRSIEPVFSGDPIAARAALRQTLSDAIGNFNTWARLQGLEGFDPISMPGIQALLSGKEPGTDVGGGIRILDIRKVE